MSHRLAAACLAVVVGCAVSHPLQAAESAPSIVGQSFELSAGDDPVEAFALAGLSIAGTSYEMRGTDGSRYRVDRAAQGRAGFVVVSRVTKDLAGRRARWEVTDAVRLAVDTSDAFTSECRSGAGQIAFLFYEPDRSGARIAKPEAGFKVDIRSGKLERAKLAAADCRPDTLAAAPRN